MTIISLEHAFHVCPTELHHHIPKVRCFHTPLKLLSHRTETKDQVAMCRRTWALSVLCEYDHAVMLVPAFL